MCQHGRVVECTSLKVPSRGQCPELLGESMHEQKWHLSFIMPGKVKGHQLQIVQCNGTR